MSSILTAIKTFLVLVATALIVFASYFFVFLKGDETRVAWVAALPFFNESTAGGDKPVDVNAMSDMGSKLNVYLESLKTLKTDTSLFNDPAFTTLSSEFKVRLPTLQAGRTNPFE